ncbi:MAG: DNA-directed RNA polymerase alpha subunit, partial [uncultured Actinomycetospora sp.]
ADLSASRTVRGRHRRHPFPVRHRAAGAGLRLHPRQLAASHPALVHPGRGRDEHPCRRGPPRVHHRPRGEGGRHRHHPEPQGARRELRGGRAGDDVPAQAGSRHRHRGRHRPAGRRDRAQPRPAHRDPERPGPPGGRAGRRAWPRLRAGRAEQGLRRRDRPHPGRLDLLAGDEGQLQGRGHPRRAADRLRQADPRRRDQAVHDAARRHRVGRPNADRALRAGPRAQRRRRGHRDRPLARRGRHDRRLRDADRGPGPHRPVLQLPQAGRHPHGRRARRPVGGRPAGHPQLRREVHRRGQDEARRSRSGPQGQPARVRPVRRGGRLPVRGFRVLRLRRRLRRRLRGSGGRRPGLRRDRAAL